jgi:hypothetical protein
MKMWYLSFWAWLIFLKMMISSSIHYLATNIILFFFMAEWYSILHFPYSVTGCWSYRLFHTFSIVNSAVFNMGVPVSLLYVDFHSFRCMSKSRYSTIM